MGKFDAPLSCCRRMCSRKWVKRIGIAGHRKAIQISKVHGEAVLLKALAEAGLVEGQNISGFIATQFV